MMTHSVEAFDLLPNSLKKSDYVDLLLFLIKEKKAVRLGANSIETYNEMSHWCKQEKYKYVISSSGLMYIAKHSWLAQLVRIVDDATFPHAFLLGKLLGYPSCCSIKAHRLGEQLIDKWENDLVQSGEFVGEYRLINPSGYLQGTSLISHVPCKCSCRKSLRIAKKMLYVIRQNSEKDSFSRWKMWMKQSITSD